MSYWRRNLSGCITACNNLYRTLLSSNITAELARRDSERGRNTFRWFTSEEAAVAEALANIIIPSDDATPGLDDVCVLGPPAIVALDALVATSTYKQEVYSRGLLAFDIWARKQHGCNFVEMRKEDQIMLFRAAQQIHDSWTESVPVTTRIWRKVQAMNQASNGSFFAASLYPSIRGDCLQVFYTSRVCWTWLEYDGPPMDEGYTSVVAPRPR